MMAILTAFVFGILAACVTEFLVMVGLAHPWATFPIAAVVAAATFIYVIEKELKS